MTIIKIYRNLPIVDQTKAVNIIRRIFPFYFKFSRGFYNIYMTIEVPFIGFDLKIGVRAIK